MNWSKIIPDLSFRGKPLYRLTNAEVVAQAHNADKRRAIYEAKCASIKAYLEIAFLEMRQENFYLEQLRDCTEVFEGVALKVREMPREDGVALDIWYGTWDIQRVRRAEIWPNCQEKGKFGMSTGYLGELSPCRGTKFTDYEDVVLKAKRWAAHGIHPLTGEKSLFG